MITTAIVWDHRGRAPKGKEGPLEIRVTINRKPYYINTGIRVRKEEWKYNAIINRPDSVELNERLAIVLRSVTRQINECLEHDTKIDVAAIRRNVYNGEKRSQEFLDWIEEQIPLLNVAEGTRRHYRTLFMRLAEYGEMRTWRDITPESILHWDAWLHKLTVPLTNTQLAMREEQIRQGLPVLEPRTIGQDGVFNYHKNLRRLLYLAEKVGKIERNPYSKLHGEFRPTKKENVEYLTEEEMHKVMALELRPMSQEAIARDLFVVQMFTGMAYKDMCQFSISNYKLVDGKWIANAERVKTGVAFIGHLLPPVVDVLKRYDWVLPRMDNADYNHALKAIQAAAGISTRMHSHLARHTFGTFMLSNGVKVENLQRMMGHRDISMTQRYAKTLAKAVHDEFDMIEKKMTELK